jgi:hypothetical protein
MSLVEPLPHQITGCKVDLHLAGTLDEALQDELDNSFHLPFES